MWTSHNPGLLPPIPPSGRGGNHPIDWLEGGNQGLDDAPLSSPAAIDPSVRLATATELADKPPVSARTLRRWRSEDRAVPIKIGRTICFRLSDVVR